MRLQIKSFPAALFALVALSAITFTAPSASAVGQDCPATNSGNATMVQNGVSSGASYEVQTMGVITSWGVNTGGWGSPNIVAATLNYGIGNSWRITRQTAFQQVLAGTNNVYYTRMSAVAGEKLGMVSSGGNTLMCSDTLSAADKIDSHGDQQSSGSEWTPEVTFTGRRLAIWANVEPDTDLDGYGDVTQDKCPASPDFQDACPVLAISQQLTAAKGAIAITATSSLTTSLEAFASVKVPKLGRRKASTVTFSTGPKPFAAGQIKTLKLKLPSRLTAALAARKKSKKLKVTVTLSGSEYAKVAKSVKSISLPGTKK